MKSLIPNASAHRASAVGLFFIAAVCVVSPSFAQPATCTAPPSGLVAWWPGEGNGNDLIGTNRGNLFNSVTFTTGVVGQAFSFDGSDDYILAARSPILDVGKGGGLTIEGWIRPLDLSQLRPIIEWNDGLGNIGAHFWVSVDTVRAGDGVGDLFVNLVDTAGFAHQVRTPSDTLAVGIWQHVALTYDKLTGLAVIYRNGIVVGQTIVGIFTPQTSYSLYFGFRPSGSLGGGFYRGGQDEISLYSRALSAAEILSIYNTSSAGKCTPSCIAAPSGMVARWPLDGSGNEEVGSKFLALSGNPTFAQGRVKAALAFDGFDDAGRVAAHPVLNVGAGLGLTIEAWIRPAQVTSSAAILEWSDAVTALGLHFYHSTFSSISGGGAGSLFANLMDTNGTAHHISSAAGILNTNAFQHVALTYDKVVGVARLFLNGEQMAEKNVGVFVPETRGDLFFGYRELGGITYRYSGMIDDVSLYNRALSASEIQNIYVAGSAGKCLGSPTPPSIIFQPTSRTVTVEETATFSVTAIGTAPLSYQWRFNDADLAGATGPSILLSNVQLAQAGNYNVIVSNAVGSVTSAVAVLTVNPTPSCMPSPGGLVAWWPLDGSTSEVVGNNPLALSGNPTFAQGKVSSALTFDGFDDSGKVAANAVLNVGAGPGLTVETWIKPAQVTSPAAILEWSDEVSRVGLHFYHSISSSVSGGGSGSLFANLIDTNGVAHHLSSQSGILTVNAFQHVALSYDRASAIARLFLNGAQVAEATVGVFTPDTRADLHFGYRAVGGTPYSYSGLMDEVSLYNRALSASEMQSIYVAGSAGKCPLAATPPSIVSQPLSQTVTAGTMTTLSVAATGTAPLNYQWRFNDADLANATQPSVVVSNVQPAQAGNYSVVVGNAAGSVTSVVAVLTVSAPTPPSIVSPPSSRTVTVGDTATFSVTAAGTPPFGYQWLFNNAAIAGATQVSLTLTNVQMSQGGNYSVVVGNTAGAVTSAVAVLTIRPGPSTVRVVNVSAAAGSEVRVPVQLLAQGNENALSFSLSFDRSLLTFNELVLGGGMSAGSTLLLNTNDAANGRVGLAIALPTDATFNAGAQEVAVVRFTVASVPNAVTIPVTFSDQPTGRQVSDAQALATPSVFVPGNVTVSASTVRVVSTSAASAGEARVPVQLLAQGNENALGFSLNFDASLLALNEVVLGANVASGATLILNTNSGSGRVGVAVALSAGTAFNAGTQEVAVVKFAVAPVLNPVTIPITFADQPTVRQLSDRQARALPAVFVSGNIAIVQVEFEGDVTPRPGGNKSVSITDWVQLGRFVAGLDQIGSPSEFQRADCAPRSSKGNGAIGVSDWVQAGRYAVGLDPLTPAGGPTSPDTAATPPLSGVPPPPLNRSLCILDTSIPPGLTSTVSVRLEAQGDENALGFSVAFDPARMSFMGAVPGGGASGAALNVNTNQVDAGRVGLALALPPGSTLSTGAQEVVALSFMSLGSASGSTTVSFSDQPLLRETADALANSLDTAYTSGTVNFTAPSGPRVTFTRTEDTLILSWPANAIGFELETSTGEPGVPWNPVVGVIVVGDQKISAVSLTGGQKFFRLKKP